MFAAILFAGFVMSDVVRMLIVVRVLLGISILSFVISMGSCIVSSSYHEPDMPNVMPSGSFVNGDSNEEERYYGLFAAYSFAVSVATLFLGGISYGAYQGKREEQREREEQRKRDEQKRNI